MATVLMAVGAFVLYLVAYYTYGRWLARRLFRIDPSAQTPANELNDGVDYVPSRKEVVFGHHFTSIAGTGPIVGPAIAIIWGWLPALIWVLVGSIVMGAVHDFGALVMSLRSKGASIADLTGSVICRRARALFMAVVFFELLIVVAIFALVIASVFDLYPQSVLPVWLEIPIAVGLGVIIARARGLRTVWIASIVAVALMYVTVLLGAYLEHRAPGLLKMQTLTVGVGFGARSAALKFPPTFLWAVVLFVYCFIASVVPVHKLLQPRDFINSHQLFIAMGLLMLGVLAARPALVAPALQTDAVGAPSFFPFLFITIACGAISGFHSLVGSGTSSKQLMSESHAQLVGYGSMLTEGFLCVLVIIAVAAGIGMRYKVSFAVPAADDDPKLAEALQPVDELRSRNPSVQVVRSKDGQTLDAYLEGKAAWNEHYRSWNVANGLKPNLAAFVQGAANMMEAFGIPVAVGLAIMGVFVASFASTTLDTATRLQRYVISEVGRAVRAPVLENRYVATALAVGTAAGLALWDGKGTGAMILWPLFGALNQLLASLALLIIAVYLYRRQRPVWMIAIPFAFMLVMTGWAMVINVRNFAAKEQWHLLVISSIVLVLQVWITVEAAIIWLRIRSERRRGSAAGPAAS